MTVELLLNREIFEDIYPEESDSGDSDAMDLDGDSSDDESMAIKSLRQEKKRNSDKTKLSNEHKAPASPCLAMLESYARSFETDRPEDLEGCISHYGGERRKEYDNFFVSEVGLKDLEKSRAKIDKRLNRELHAIQEMKDKSAKEQMNMLKKKRRARKDKINAADRLKEERIKFWPRKLYRVTLSLYTHSDMTPATSRRASIDSLAKTISEDSCVLTEISLCLSYITHSAWWTPRYDLSIDTLKASGSILYRAEFYNTTSETWKDAKLILSTSQTAFQGLTDSIPLMKPWHICLEKADNKGLDKNHGAFLSAHEIGYKPRNDKTLSDRHTEPRSSLFGLQNKFQLCSLLAIPPLLIQQYPQSQQQQRQQIQAQAQMQQQYQQSSTLFGACCPQTQQARSDGGRFFGSSHGLSQPRTSEMGQRTGPVEDDETFTSPFEPALATQESDWSEQGMTATYEIPSRRTIAPSDTKRRYEIAAFDLKDVNLSYHIVPKLQAAAFLKARIRNTSSITLLKGPVGLTVDGSFLGNASLPRSSASEPFSLNLGAGPSIKVIYSAPVVKKGQTGLFQSKESCVYTRTCTVTNTKSDRSLQCFDPPTLRSPE